MSHTDINTLLRKCARNEFINDSDYLECLRMYRVNSEIQKRAMFGTIEISFAKKYQFNTESILSIYSQLNLN